MGRRRKRKPPPVVEPTPPPVACGLCGRPCKSERGVRAHQARTHRIRAGYQVMSGGLPTLGKRR